MAKLFNCRNIFLGIFIFINITFCVRYAIRISTLASISATIIYALIAYSIIKYSNKKHLSLKWIILIGIIWLIGCVTLLQFIPLETIRVDRVEMVELFWDAVHNGEYPYDSKGQFNGNHPGPMPIYFVLCYPFYLIKQYAIIPILSLIALVFYTYSTDKRNSTLLALLIITSPACYWEILCRSTIIFNTLIFLAWFVSLSRFKDFSNKLVCLSAIIGGLVLSTRSILAIPIFAFGIYSLRYNSVNKTILWGVILLLTLLTSHLPLLYYGMDSILRINPIWLQSNFFMPMEYIGVFVLLTIGASLKCNSFNQICYVCGLILFAITLTYIIRYICCTGIEHSITKGCDISYFLFSVPFLFYSLINNPINATRSNNNYRDAGI